MFELIVHSEIVSDLYGMSLKNKEWKHVESEVEELDYGFVYLSEYEVEYKADKMFYYFRGGSEEIKRLYEDYFHYDYSGSVDYSSSFVYQLHEC